jgi:DNA-binding beta-propeller fold protein YncE
MEIAGGRSIGAGAAAAIALGSACLSTVEGPAGEWRDGKDVRAYRSPLDVSFSPDGSRLAVIDPTAVELVLADVASRRVVRRVHLARVPSGVVWAADGRSLFVAERSGGSIAEVDAAGATRRRFELGGRPAGLAVAPRRGLLLVADSAFHAIQAVDLRDGRLVWRAPAVREPGAIAVAPDESICVAANRLPLGDASEPSISAAISLIDLGTPSRNVLVPLPPNSANVFGAAISPDGRWAYATHTLGRTTLPTQQIEFGWINANAVTIVDLAARRRYATVLLDQPDRGLADPWGVAVSPDGRALWIAGSGVHRLARLDLRRLHPWLTAMEPALARAAPPADGTDFSAVADADLAAVEPNSGRSVELVLHRLPAAYGRGVILDRVLDPVALPGRGPRGLAISPDGRTVAAAMYYAGAVALIDAASLRVDGVVDLGPQPPPDEIRRGEAVFHDATQCHQEWLSCATCHPDGRADGLNWDLFNDGAGNPKNTKSLCWSAVTPPAMSEGVRPSMEAAAFAGFQFILFRRPRPDELRAVEAYLRALRPEPSPFLANGRLSPKAARGKILFESQKTGCAACHPAPLFTDLRMHDVGTAADFDTNGRFDTPALVELWRTAPYLHHGKAVSLREVLTTFNPDDRHGRTASLFGEDLDALIEYLLSL